MRSGEDASPEPASQAGDQPTFFYDLGDPDCYLVAERVMGIMPVVPEWEPVLRDDLPGLPAAADDVERLAARAQEQSLLPLRWPKVWPQDGEYAALAATWAKQGGRTVAFSLALFRQVFAAGRDLGDPDTVMLAAAACELHPRALAKGTGTRSVTRSLHAAGARAAEAGVTRLPAIQVRDRLFAGENAPEAAAAALAQLA